ncbi:MAG: hypothetical protein HYX75_23255 [Acidobacteria bacterium]|nr:hypothetical protein [Acidobacteriota bacterium]
MKTRKRPYPYATLEELSNTVLHHHAVDAIPFVPALMEGLDARPWQDPREFFRFPTSRQWCEAVRRLAAELGANPQVGQISLEPRVQAFIIYAWNEYGVGGILAPTRGDKYMKLVQLRRAIGR